MTCGRLTERLVPRPFLLRDFFVGSDLSVANEDDAMGVLGHVHFVGHQNNGVALRDADSERGS